MNELRIEPFGGLAGDMLLAALLDLARPELALADLEHLAADLVPGECRLVLERVQRGGIAGSHLTVQTPESGTHVHRHFADLAELLERSSLSARVREQSRAVLWRIAVAEGHVHAKPPGEIHFHEIGAVDTLIDVVGAVFALERLGVERVQSTPPLCGGGTVRCAHGVMPVPAPAVVELLRGRPLALGGGDGERLTPTAAALLAELADILPHAEVADVAVDAIGYGAGTREFAEGPPNLCRVLLSPATGANTAGEAAPARRRQALLVEAGLDDATGEELGHLVRGLREAGALDVWTCPVQMKKDRPGVVVAALCREAERGALERVFLERSPTLGLRWRTVERTEWRRRGFTVEVEGTRVRVKERLRPDGGAPTPLDLTAEQDDLEVLAVELGTTLREAHARVFAEAVRVRPPLEAEGVQPGREPRTEGDRRES